MASIPLIIGSGNAHKAREISEILVGVAGVRVMPFSEFDDEFPEIEETGRTFAENSALKAELLAKYLFARRGVRASGRHTAVDSSDTRAFDKIAMERSREFAAASRSGSGRFSLVGGDRSRMRSSDFLVMADDSGLVVDALGGAPGVMSARYAGRHGNDDANNAKLLREMEGVANDRRTARFVCAISLATQHGLLFTVEGRVEGRIARVAEGRNGFGYDPVFYYPPFERTFGQVDPEQKNKVSHRADALRQFRERLTRVLTSEGMV